MHVELTDAYGNRVEIYRPFCAVAEKGDGWNSCLHFGSNDSARFRETPAEIAAKLDAKAREARVRENAARILASSPRGTNMKECIADAVDLENELDAHFASGEGREP